MAKKRKNKPRKLPKSLRKGALPKPVDDVLAAGIGAIAQATKKGADTFDALVERGERVANEGSEAARSAVGEVEAAVTSLLDDARAGVSGAQAQVEGIVERALDGLGIAGRDEIDALKARIDTLQARLGGRAAAVSADAAAGSVASTRYEVVPHAEGWAIRKAGASRATAVLGTKKEAVRDARQLAKTHRPSTLVICKADGSVGDTVDYDAD